MQKNNYLDYGNMLLNTSLLKLKYLLKELETFTLYCINILMCSRNWRVRKYLTNTDPSHFVVDLFLIAEHDQFASTEV